MRKALWSSSSFAFNKLVQKSCLVTEMPIKMRESLKTASIKRRLVNYLPCFKKGMSTLKKSTEHLSGV